MSKSTHGRGAQSNPTGRYEAHRHEIFDDGWSGADEEPEPLRTQVFVDATRSIISRNESPDVPFDRSINPYRGCEHGCIYCFARPSHAYLGLSPGLDFESKLWAKPEAAALLRAELRKPSYMCEVLALGANVDPYQPIERQWRISRAVLEVLEESAHPVAIVTKSNLVLRDVDILARMAARNLAVVMISVTTLDRTLARKLEPRAPTPDRRLEAMAALAEAGVPVGVLASPLIPALNDPELEAILEASRACGARWAGYVLVRLPLELKELFAEWLAAHYPLRAKRVLDLIRDTRGGELYQAQFGQRMRGTGAYAQMVAQRFAKAKARSGFEPNYARLDTSLFRPPAPRGGQLSLW